LRQQQIAQRLEQIPRAKERSEKGRWRARRAEDLTQRREKDYRLPTSDEDEAERAAAGHTYTRGPSAECGSR
jgi:hypothetical protein